MKLSNRLKSLRTACAVVALVFGLGVGGAWAQSPGGDPDPKAATLSEILKLAQADDLAGARALAIKTANQFEASGDRFYAARYSLSAMLMASYQTDWKFIVDTYGPQFDALLADLDAKEPIQGDRLIHVMAFAKAGLGDAAERDRLGKTYVDRIVARNGPTSEPALMAPIDVAVVQIKTGDPQKGYDAALPALEALAATDFHRLTLARYHEVGMALEMARRSDLAMDVFGKGVNTPAVSQMIEENAELHMSYARVVGWNDALNFQLRSYELYEAAIHISRQLGDNDKVLARMNEFALALNNTGATGKAITTMENVVEGAEKLYGENDDRTLGFYTSYAEILRNFGAPSNAADADLDVYNKRLKNNGEKDERVLAAANALGQDYLTLGEFDKAREYFTTTRKLAVHSQHQANIESNADAWLFVTDVLSGKLTVDEAATKRLAAIAGDQSFAPILRIRAAESAGKGLAAKNQIQAAFDVLKAAREVSFATFSPSHPVSFEITRQIADTVKGEDPQGASNILEDLARDLNQWINVQSSLSNDTKIAELLRGHADATLADLAAFAEVEEKARDPFVLMSYRWKTVVSGDMTSFRRFEATLPESDAKTAGLVRNVMRLTAQLNAVRSSQPDDEFTNSVFYRREEAYRAFQARMTELGKEFEINESIAHSAGADLKPGEVFVNYFITRRWGPDRLAPDAIREQILYAIVTDSSNKSKIVNLGDPRKLDQIGTETQIADLRGTRGAVPLTDIKKPFVELNAHLFKPLEAELKDAKTVFVVPDGPLFSVPFSLVQDEEGKLLEDRFEVRVLTTPDAVINANAKSKLDDKGEVLLVGDVDYRRGTEPGAEPLPGTGAEIAAIGKLAEGRGARVNKLTHAEATEAVLRKDVEGARIVHLATHGAFGNQTNQGAAGVDALWQSEIVLANSGDQQSRKRDDTDGRLYAFEVMDWDLSKLDLLVLSACETGRGEESFLTGLRGLPTAIGIAGARRSLLTLWPVEDKGTANFMIRYYEVLGEGKTYAEALRTTRLEAREGKIEAASDPRVWAAFVLFEG